MKKILLKTNKNVDFDINRDEEYLDFRKRKFSYKHRLKKRAEEIVWAFKKYSKADSQVILDIGCCDDYILDRIVKGFDIKLSVGMDINIDGLRNGISSNIKLISGDAEKIPFKDNSFDVVTASALIEHLDDIGKLFNEIKRSLNSGGIAIFTIPNPVYDRLYFFKDKIGHKNQLEDSDILNLLSKSSLKLEEIKYFLVCPYFEIPFEKKLIKFFRKICLQKIMFNRLIVVRK